MPLFEWRQFQFQISLSQKSSSSWLKHFVARVCGRSHLAVLLGSGSGDWVKQPFYLDQSPECVGNSDARVYPLYLVKYLIGVTVFWERHGGSRCLSELSCCVTNTFLCGMKSNLQPTAEFNVLSVVKVTSAKWFDSFLQRHWNWALSRWIALVVIFYILH